MPERSDLKNCDLTPIHRIQRRKCFTCQVEKPLNEFLPNKRKYQIKKYLGRTLNCIDCLIKNSENDLKVVNFNYETNKYEIINFNSKDELIEFYDKKKADEYTKK